METQGKSGDWSKGTLYIIPDMGVLSLSFVVGALGLAFMSYAHGLMCLNLMCLNRYTEHLSSSEGVPSSFRRSHRAYLDPTVNDHG